MKTKNFIESPPLINEKFSLFFLVEHHAKPKKNYGGALDLSNDEAYLPESSENANNVGEDSGPMTFTGMVIRVVEFSVGGGNMFEVISIKFW